MSIANSGFSTPSNSISELANLSVFIRSSCGLLTFSLKSLIFSIISGGIFELLFISKSIFLFFFLSNKDFDASANNAFGSCLFSFVISLLPALVMMNANAAKHPVEKRPAIMIEIIMPIFLLGLGEFPICLN